MKNYVGVIVFVFLSSLVCAGQGRSVEIQSGPGSALKVTLSGSLDLDFVYRGPIINEASFWQSAGAIAGFGLNSGESASDFNDGQNMLNGALLLNLDAELKDKITVVSSFGNLRASRNDTNPVTDNLNLGDPTSRSSTDLIFYDLYVQFEEIFDPKATLKAGQITTYATDYTGRGSTLFFAPGYAESPWAGSEVFVAWPETRRVTNLPAGVIGSYKASDVFDLDLILLPFVVAATEERSFNGNEGAYLINGSYKLDSTDSKLNGLFGFLKGPSDIGTESTTDAYDGGIIWVAGFGGALNQVVPDVKLYGEFFLEFGELAESNVSTLDDLDISAYAFQFGAVYMFEDMANKPWIDAGFIYVTGEDDSSTANGDLSVDNTGAKNDDVEEFLSYENNNDFLIIENNLFGLDIDSNYWAMKFKGGLMVGNVNLTGKLGLFNLVEDVRVGANKEDDLGTELDFVAVYVLNDSASLDFNFAYLFGSDVIERFTSDKDDLDYMLTTGTTIKF